MYAVRIHGRGGQGVVTAAELLSVAAFIEGKHAQAFPSFGPERSGAPVVAFCRIDDSFIRTREPIIDADLVVVVDATLLHQPALLNGLKTDGVLLINSAKAVAELPVDPDCCARVLCVDATELAVRHLGKPLPNAALLGAVAAIFPAISLGSVVSAIERRFAGKVAGGNVAAAREANRELKLEMQGSAAHA